MPNKSEVLSSKPHAAKKTPNTTVLLREQALNFRFQIRVLKPFFSFGIENEESCAPNNSYSIKMAKCGAKGRNMSKVGEKMSPKTGTMFILSQ
jgi:hypothetical protein